MNWQRLSTGILAAALLAVGAGAWWLTLEPSLTVDASALATLPRMLGPWEGRDVSLESSVEAELRADFNLQRAYVDSSGDVIWLYVGYYGTRHGGRPEHTPRGCYTGAGWGIRSARTIEVDPVVGFRVNEYVVERDGAQRLVHYWYRSHRRTGLLGGLDQNLDRLAGRLLNGRADGALVRISTPLSGPGDEVMARNRLLDFATEVDSELAQRWPRENRKDG